MGTLLVQIEQRIAPDQQELLIRCLRWFRAKYKSDLTSEAIEQSRLYDGDWKTHAFAPEDFTTHLKGSSDYRFFTDDRDAFAADEVIQHLTQLFSDEMELGTTAEHVALLVSLIQHDTGLNGPWFADDAIVIRR